MEMNDLKPTTNYAKPTTNYIEMNDLKPTTNYARPSLIYRAIILLFRFVLRVFYSNVVVEGTEHLTRDGIACMVCANHVNSLTDALLLATTVKSRSVLRLTAKATQFHRGTFTSWLIENAGTLPIERPKDYRGKDGEKTREVDNRVVFGELIKALGYGDAVVMFPEGLSRYYPALAPMKQGLSRIIADVLTEQQNQGNPKFVLAIQTCSITYLHRNLFRSDVLVTFHPPILVSPLTHPLLLSTPSTPSSEPAIRHLTSQIGDLIRSGTLDAPEWGKIRAAETARRIYAPLGTRVGLGEHVRLTQKFLELLTGEGEEMKQLGQDLKTYQDLLHLHGLKDDRVRNPRLLRKLTLVKRLFVRISGAIFLSILATPGLLMLWGPIFFVTRRAAEKTKRSGPAFDTFDEVAQTKLIYGFLTGFALYIIYLLLSLPFLALSVPLLPIFFWMSLRWMEDLTSTLRALLALSRLLFMGKKQLVLLREMRAGLEERVGALATSGGLPRDSGELVGKKGWRGGLHAGFFSLRRRRKKDWNEVLRLYDQTEYPIDDTGAL